MSKSGGSVRSSGSTAGFKGSPEIDRHIAAWNKLSFEDRLSITRSPGGYKAWVAEHFGAKAAANTPMVSAAGKRVGRPPMSAEEKAAKTQARKVASNAVRREKAATARASLPHEAQPGEKLRPVAAPGTVDISAHVLDASKIQQLYGDHQLGAALERYSLSSLKEMASDVRSAHPTTRPSDARSKASLVSYMTRTLTGGKYSADFAKTTKAATTPRAPRAPRTAEQEARRATNAQKRAADKSAFNQSLHLNPTGSVDLSKWFGENEFGRSNVFHSRLNPYFAHALYGDQQLRASLGGHSLERLREAADVVNRRNGWSSGSKNAVRGASKSALADRITQAVIAHPSAPFIAENLYS